VGCRFDGTRSPVTGAELSAALAYKAPSEQEALVLLSIPVMDRGSNCMPGLHAAVLLWTADRPLILFFELASIMERFFLGGGQGDGFLNQLLPKDGIRSDFQLIVGFSYAHGIYFKGSASLEIQVPSISAGAIEIQALYLMLASVRLPLEISSMIRPILGPMQAVVGTFRLTANR